MTPGYRRLQLRHWKWTLFIGWSAAVALLLVWNLLQVRQYVHDQAYRELQATFSKGEALSKWAVGHGGVYVEAGKQTRPDPNLSMLPERDVVTPSGRMLTLVNPATLLNTYYGAGDSDEVRGRLTSLSPLDPDNRPDAWEQQALEDLRREGGGEIVAVVDEGDRPLLRVIKARRADASCLKCHGMQGLAPGDLIGGLSLSVPFDTDFAAREYATVSVGYGLLWIIGLLGIQFGGRLLDVRIRQRDAAYRELKIQDSRIRGIVKGSLDAIVTFDREGRVTGWNPGARELFGWDESEALGRPMEAIVQRMPESSPAAFSPEMAPNRSRFEATAIHRDGRRFPIELSLAPLDYDAGAHAAFIRDVTAQKRAAEKIERDYISQQVIGRLLKLSIESIDFRRKLDRSLEIILSTPWLSLQSKGAIFLSQGHGELELAAHRGLGDAVVEGCARVPLGKCLCGRAARSRELVFADGIDERHDHLFPGMQPHGHYCLPILSGDALLGVLTLYVDEGHTRTAEEERFLQAIAHTLGGIIQRYRTEEQLRHAAFYDELTRLPNRALFMDRLEHALGRLSRGTPFAVLYLDLERFKNINDSLGHTAGDEVLKAVAERVSECVRPADTVARLGGDEFTVLLESIGEPEAALVIANRIHRALAEPLRVGGHEVFTSAAIGIALAHEGHGDGADLLREADTAMYQAKRSGAAQTALFDETMHRKALALLTLETELRRAVEREEFEIHYQPIVTARGATPTGFEALLRWQHPERGRVSPEEFIPVAEETGLINDIGRRVLEQACRQASEWHRRFPSHPKPHISVNLSAVQFAQPDLLGQVRDALDASGLPGSYLALEVTESVLMEANTGIRKTLTELRGLGVRLYIDDFGTGYSSLSYLHEFPFDALKIDRSFTRDLSDSEERRGIVQAVLAIARHLGMAVIAEGVEDARQLALLRRFGCDYVQGFYYAKPLPPEEAEVWLSGRFPSGRSGG